MIRVVEGVLMVIMVFQPSLEGEKLDQPMIDRLNGYPVVVVVVVVVVVEIYLYSNISKCKWWMKWSLLFE